MSMVSKWQHLKIPFHEIEVATENFKNLIGQGGYGWVFKGKLLLSGNETMVAVKRLNERFGQGLKEFLTEIQLLVGQQHPNLISLIGYCDEGKEKILVYEYAARGSLDQYIRRARRTNSTTLTWLQRLKICVDVARGLEHLHYHAGAPRMIIHRDIKSANILIDENWVGKISDLGLSKLTVTGFGMSEIVSNPCGTKGYFEPEYCTTAIVNKKSDVYSFGVVLFEVLCGRLCRIDSDDGFSLSSKSAKDHFENNTLDKIIDQSLSEHIGSYSMTKFSKIAYRCLHDDREQRPAMDVVVKELEEALKFPEASRHAMQKRDHLENTEKPLNKLNFDRKLPDSDLFYASPKQIMDNVVPDIRKVTVKATFKDDMLKFQIPISSGLFELQKEVANRTKLKSADFRLKYKDEGGVLIPLACDADLQNLLGGYSSNPTIKLIIQANEASDTRKVTVKATFKDDMVKFQFPISSGMFELQKEVANRTKLKSADFRLKYKDEDDDLIPLGCDADLQYLLRGYSSNQTIKLIIQANEASDTRKMIVKATFKDDLIKFQIPFSSSLFELQKELANRTKLKSADFRLKYKDEENDLIPLVCDADMQNLLGMYSRCYNTVVKLLIEAYE